MSTKKKTKKKTTKKQSKKKSSELAAFYRIVYTGIAILLSSIGVLEIGFIGEFLSKLFVYFFGYLAVPSFLLIILISIIVMFGKKLSEVPKKYYLALFLVWLIAGLSIANWFLIERGNNVLEVYRLQGSDVWNKSIVVEPGLLGSAIYALTSFLFDKIGTWILIALLVIIVAFIVIPHEWVKKKQVSMKESKEARKIKSEEKKLKKQAEESERIALEEQQALEEALLEEESIPMYDIEDLDREGMDMPYDASLHFINADSEANVEDDYEVHEIVIEEDEEESFEQMEIPLRSASGTLLKDSVKPTQTSDTVTVMQDFRNYKLPKAQLLKDAPRSTKSIANAKNAAESGKQLINILDQFGVSATLQATHIGPSVTKFEIKPDTGVRVNRISSLQHDIKMALAATDLRIEAPIPGKSAVGIEIPNEEKTMVYMKELIKSVPPRYDNSKTLFALGRDLMGNSVFGELNKMPHLLIAGATGSGKSVCVNSIITSILMRARPDEVKLLLIDPKKVEFTPYKNIPHLIGPVITNPDEAKLSLKAIEEIMDNRYEKFAQVGVRNIAGYNAYVEKHPEDSISKEPLIVVVIDELADLMLVAAKEVEASIQRITQLARAAGIHLIVATQRPSVDVITGVIKANIPSRIAFAVSSAVDSRTILDQAGAEKLLGYGDMLYIPVGETVATRVQGVFVSDDEVQAIADFAAKQSKPAYFDAFTTLNNLDRIKMTSSGDVEDPLYEEVREFVIVNKKASTSLVQRKFSVGYARAARLVDMLEEQGVVGPQNGSKPRDVLISVQDELEE